MGLRPLAPPLPRSRRVRRQPAGFCPLGLGLVLLLLTVDPAPAATVADHNTWAQVAISGPLLDRTPGRDRWRYSFDSPHRYDLESRHYYQSVWRLGLGYQFSPRLSLWAGYGYTHTDPQATRVHYGEPRWFQQLLWTERRGNLTFRYRLRLEERFPDTGNDMGLRLRHQLRLNHPLPGSKKFYGVLWEELFHNLRDTDYGARTGFDQNRVFAGLGCHWSEILRTEAGYLHQFGRRVGQPDRILHILALRATLAFK